MTREAFYVKSKGKYPILDILPAVNQKAKVARMDGLSKNLDSIRQYGFTASFYYPAPHVLRLLEGENLDDKNVSRFSLAVKAVELPEFNARVSYSSMMGISGHSINYHVDKKFKLKVDELTQDHLLHKLRQVGLIHQLGDSEAQLATVYKEKSITRTVVTPARPNLVPANTGPGSPYPGFRQDGIIPETTRFIPEKIVETDYAKSPHFYFDLRLAKYLQNGELHSILDFINCKIIGFKQSSFDYSKTNAMSEIDFEIVFDELISVPPTDKYPDKSPSQILRAIDSYQEIAAAAVNTSFKVLQKTFGP